MAAPPPPRPQTIVCLNFGGIGDQILFSPVLSAVRRAVPEARLTFVTEKRCAAVMGLLPQVDDTRFVVVRQGFRLMLFVELLLMLWQLKPDAVISSGTSPFIAILLWLSGARIRIGYNSHRFLTGLLSRAAPLGFDMYAGQMYFSLAATFLEELDLPMSQINTWIPELYAYGDRHAVLQDALEKATHTDEARVWRYRIFIHPGVSRVSVKKGILKAWDPLNWAELIHRLIGSHPDWQVVLLGGPDDHEDIDAILSAMERLGGQEAVKHPQFVNFFGLTESLTDLASVLTMGTMLVSVDSGPMHLAVGLKIPLVALFSPTSERKLLPPVPWVQAVHVDDLPCRPCLFDVRQQSCNQPVCLDIPVDKVMAGVESMMVQLGHLEPAQS